jgi:signal transduction histidine kinase
VSARRRPSVTTVVLVPLVALTTLLLGTLGAVSYAAERSRAESNLRAELGANADQLAIGLELAVWNIDRAQIDRLLDGLDDTPDIAAVVVRAAGQTHARVRDAAWRFVPARGEVSHQGLLVARRPISFEGERVGALELLVTPRFVERDLRRSLLTTVLTILATDLLLVLCAYLLLWSTVLRPLLAVERYAAAVPAGGREAPRALGGVGTAELQSLRDSIGSMVELLARRYESVVALQESLGRSERLSAMGALVGGVAHEVRNPLFGISAALDAYEEELAQPGLATLAEALRQEVTRLTQLMAELLELGKPVVVTPSPARLDELLAQALAARGGAAERAGVRLHGDFSAAMPPVAMDRSRLRQVFENLIDNAVQHSPQGGTVTVAAAATDGAAGGVECRVEDEGPGFRPEDLAVVFEPFFTRRDGGTGLGLSIVQRIVHEHGGEVTAANRPQGGAVVIVRLPRAEAT